MRALRNCRAATRRRVAMFGTCTALAVLSVAAVGATSAQASHCPSGYACGWANANYEPSEKILSDEPWTNFAYHSTGACPGGTWTDCVSSLWDETPYEALWFTGVGATGSAYENNVGTGTSYVGSYWNDSFKSLYYQP
jgi:Peptidase inhibitor family I36